MRAGRPTAVAPLGPDPIPGIDAAAPQFATPEQVFAGKEIGERVLVLDGDGYFMGVSLAELLADRGKRVTLVTPFASAAPYTDWTLEGPNLRRMMREKGIGERLSQWVERVETGNALRVTLYDLYRDGFRRTERPAAGACRAAPALPWKPFACDSVILCTARLSNTALYRGLKARSTNGRIAGSAACSGPAIAWRRATSPTQSSTATAWRASSTIADPERPRAIIRERPLWGARNFPELGDRVL